MVFLRRPPEIHGAPYSTLGSARISRLRFGVPPCQARLSRNTPAPAGAPTSVERAHPLGFVPWRQGRHLPRMRSRDLPYGTILPSQIGHHEIDRDHARGGIDDPSVSLQVQILCANFARVVSGTRLTVVFCLLSSIPIALAWTTRFSVPWFNSRRSVCRCWHPFRDTHAT